MTWVGGAVRLKAMRRRWRDDSSADPMSRGILQQDPMGPVRSRHPGPPPHRVYLGEA
jgi:hypothetical protein